MTRALYDSVCKYVIKARCVQPMHIGGVNGNKGEVLIHPVTKLPFIQASAIAGVLSAYVEKKDKKLRSLLFGRSAGTEQQERKSSTIVTDGVFVEGQLHTELRPRVKINSKLGCVAKQSVKGSMVSSGQKLNIEYITEGSVFVCSIYLMAKKEEITDMQSTLEETIAALDAGIIKVGGQHSNGCGRVKLDEVLRDTYDLCTKEDRERWCQEEGVQPRVDILKNLRNMEIADNCYTITASAVADSAVLVKALGVDRNCIEKSLKSRKDNSKLPDAMNLVNGNGEFILPGSTWKGLLRNRIAMIASYIGKSKSIVEEIFENVGCIEVTDSRIDEYESNEQFRIRIDKFTGGVMNQALFSEAPVSGKFNIKISVHKKKKQDDDFQKAVVGFVILVLRDLSIGAISVGSGSSIGRGVIHMQEITIKKKEQLLSHVNCETGDIECGETFVKDCLKCIGEVEINEAE